jgi:ABC-type transport system substrate-binding protein
LVSSAAHIVSADLRRVSASDSGVNQAACGVTTRRAFEPGLARPIGAQQLGHRLDWRLDRQHVEPRGGDVSPPQMRQANYGNYDDPAEIELYDRMLREPDFARQRQLMRQFEKLVLDTEAHEIYLLWRYRIVPYRSYVKGWKVSPSHYVNQDLATIWLDK